MTSDMVERVNAQMGKFDLDIEELTAIHLKHLIANIRASIKTDVRLRIDNAEKLPMDLVITVPQLWEPPACRKMVLAVRSVAKELGIRRVSLVFEAECATAWHLYSARNFLAPGCEIGDEIIVIDLGALTLDGLRAIYASNPLDGISVILRILGRDKGNAHAGSEHSGVMLIRMQAILLVDN